MHGEASGHFEKAFGSFNDKKHDEAYAHMHRGRNAAALADLVRKRSSTSFD
jgi:hypothetical protein